MEESSRQSMYSRPMTLAEMMPSLGGILPNNSVHKMSVRKTGKKSVAAPHTTGKDFKPSVPLTMAQLKAELQALKPKTPSRGRAPPSTIKKMWNMSTKCEKKHVSNVNAGTKNLTARKILNFQPVSKPVMCNIPRPPIRHTFVPPRAKPEKNTNNLLKHLNNKNARISGIFQIPETPATSNPRMSTKCVVDDKENMPNRTIPKQHTAFDESFKQLIGDKKPTFDLHSKSKRKSLAPRQYKENKETQTILEESRARVVSDKVKTNVQVTCTQLAPQKMSIDMDESFKHLQCEKRTDSKRQSPSNISLCSRANSEQSFLEQENVIYNETVKNVLQAAFEDSPSVSTPFKKYRNVEEYFNESSEFENSVTAANITQYDGASMAKPDGIKEEGDILSLCDLMGKAQVTYDAISTEKYNVELLKMKNELENERRFILMSLKRNEFMLNSVNKLLSLDEIPKNTKSVQKSKSILQRNRLRSCGPKMETQCLDQQDTCKSFSRRVSKSPSYKIPKHSPCLRKRALYKSVPVDLNIKPVTPKFTNVAMNVYMKMKKENKFLVTPVAHKTLPFGKVPNTPAITSRNLQNQLEKLYNETP